MKRILINISFCLIIFFIACVTAFMLNERIRVSVIVGGKEPYNKQQIKKLEKLAENSNGFAAYLLAGHYSDYEDNSVLYSHWLAVAATNKYPRAMLLLGERLQKSSELMEVNRGANLLDEAASLGNQNIKCNAGLDLADNPLMKDRAIYWLRIAIRDDCELGKYQLGRLLVETSLTREEGVRILESYIDDNSDCSAKYVLGKALYDGMNTRQRAVNLLKESALEGCSEAGVFLASK